MTKHQIIDLKSHGLCGLEEEVVYHMENYISAVRIQPIPLNLNGTMSNIALCAFLKADIYTFPWDLIETFNHFLFQVKYLVYHNRRCFAMVFLHSFLLNTYNMRIFLIFHKQIGLAKTIKKIKKSFS
uniref:Uncharacterized protein n=2 Tax=Rhizophora mucronata TaxID=61149 RepID=A0A2P2LJ84_RHIMU